MLASPLGRKLARAAALEPFKRTPKDAAGLELEDASLEQFLAARLGPELARTLGSALVHGIYAADSRQLSIKAAFPTLWEAAKRGNGSFMRGMFKTAPAPASTVKDEYKLGDVQTLMEGVSVYSFRDGMITLVDAMEKALQRQSNVEIVKNDSAVRLLNDASNELVTVSDFPTNVQDLPFIQRYRYKAQQVGLCWPHTLYRPFLCPTFS